MDKYLNEEWKSTLIPYNDKEYAMKQLDQLHNDVRSIISWTNSQVAELRNKVDQIKCGLTCGHSWELDSFDKLTYPCRKPPGVYKYKCIHCGETIILQADKKKDWEPFIKVVT